MLNRKNLVILVGALAVLVIVAMLQKTSHQNRTNRSSSTVLIDGEFASADLSQVTIDHGQDLGVVTLDRGPEGWLVTSAWNTRANGQKIDSLLRTVSNLRGEYRSDSQDVLADYGFTEKVITISGLGQDGVQAFSIQVGGKPEGGQGCFVKRPDSNEVFYTGKNILSELGLWSGPERPENRHFLELQAYTADRQNVNVVALQGEDTITMAKEFAMVEPAEGDTLVTEPYTDRTQWEWRLSGKDSESLGMAAKTKADGVLGAVVNIRAQDVVDPSAGLASYGLDGEGSRSVSVYLEGVDTPEIVIFGGTREAEGDAPAGTYMVVPSQGATIWVVGDYAVNNIFKTLEEMKPEE